ncbi:MAG TPA: archaemetzincin family Zn-dependent metalloprotease [Thermodesulfobacteriota bacterium]|nr:archaemetzincin family Zn-dependent metalloprotease [Thermodesulfobacteriota bacterium]
MKRILVVPFKGVDKGVIDHLERKIKEILGYEVVVNEEQAVIPVCRKRGTQLFAKDLFPVLRGELRKKDADAVLGVIGEDLYVEGLNFIFGLAYSDLSIISLHRLVSEDRGLFYRRAVKEAVHELGHLAGLGHCSNARCVMRFSNSLEDTDVKNETFCGECRERLKGMVDYT